MKTCTCGFISCVCEIRDTHADGCKFRAAALCSIGIECEHGRDVCPICDPCTCGHGVAGQVGPHHFKTLERAHGKS